MLAILFGSGRLRWGDSVLRLVSRIFTPAFRQGFNIPKPRDVWIETLYPLPQPKPTRQRRRGKPLNRRAGWSLYG